MNPHCARCGKIVYATEKVNCLDKVTASFSFLHSPEGLQLGSDLPVTYNNALLCTLHVCLFFFLVLAQRMFPLRGVQNDPEHEQLQRIREEALLQFVCASWVKTQITYQHAVLLF